MATLHMSKHTEALNFIALVREHGHEAQDEPMTRNALAYDEPRWINVKSCDMEDFVSLKATSDAVMTWLGY